MKDNGHSRRDILQYLGIGVLTVITGGIGAGCGSEPKGANVNDDIPKDEQPEDPSTPDYTTDLSAFGMAAFSGDSLDSLYNNYDNGTGRSLRDLKDSATHLYMRGGTQHGGSRGFLEIFDDEASVSDGLYTDKTSELEAVAQADGSNTDEQSLRQLLENTIHDMADNNAGERYGFELLENDVSVFCDESNGVPYIMFVGRVTRVDDKNNDGLGEYVAYIWHDVDNTKAALDVIDGVGF
jgi:hypothetical protein